MTSPRQLDQLAHQSRNALILSLRRESFEADLEFLGEMKRARVRCEQSPDSDFEYVESGHVESLSLSDRFPPVSRMY